MPGNPLSNPEILNYAQSSAQQNLGYLNLPQAYVYATPHNQSGPAAYRLFDAAYISTGIIDPNRLGTGATGAGNLYLADDGTWKAVGGGGGGGDMYKATYDVDNDGTVDSAERIEIIVRNSTGTTLTKGTVVYLSGATGNRPNAVRAQADTEATSSKTFGIVVADINNNSDGYVACNGTLHDLDTSAFADGAALWLSATTAGAYTSTIPAEPNHTVFIGYVARSHPTQGRLVILIQNGYELNELHGVLISSEANNDLLVYESSTSLWKNKTISTIFGGTPLVSVPTLAQVTTAGNTTTNAINVGDVTSTGVVKSVVSSVTAQFTAYNPLSNYPRAQFQVGQNSSDINAGLTIAPLYSSTGVQKPVFIQISTNKNTIDSGQFGASLYLNTSVLSIATYKQDGQVSGGLPIVFSPANTEAMRIQINGNVAIGTTTDSGYKLDVNGTMRSVGLITAPGGISTVGGGIQIGDSTAGAIFYDASNRIYNNTAYGWVIYGWLYNHLAATNGLLISNSISSTKANNTFLSVAGSITASSALAQGVAFNNTLVAAANNDVLVGLDIAPTFTNGAFTGVSNLALRATGRALFNANGEVSSFQGYGTDILKIHSNGNGLLEIGYNLVSPIGSPSAKATIYNRNNTYAAISINVPVNQLGFGSRIVWHNQGQGGGSIYHSDAVVLDMGMVNQAGHYIHMFANGNVLLTGGTRTDAGYKLDVNGSTRIKGTGTTSATNALIVQNSAGTSSLTVGDNGKVYAYDSVYVGSGGPASSLKISGTNISTHYYDALNGGIRWINNTRFILYGAAAPGFPVESYNIITANGGNNAVHVFGTYTDNTEIISALVEIRSTTRGFLQSRMTNAQVLAIATPATGLQAYDTTNNKNLLYNGTVWQNIATESWVTAQGYLTSAPTPTLQQVTTAGNTASGDIYINGVRIGRGGTQIQDTNTVVGRDALGGNAGSGHNTAIGSEAFFSWTIGLDNTGVGSQALYSLANGSRNVAVGRSALRGVVGGNNNIGIGDRALTLAAGSNNVAIGSYTGYGNGAGAGSGNVFLGYQAGYNETGSNTLYIANSLSNTIIYGNFATGNVSIGSTTDAGYKLYINGAVKSTGRNQASYFDSIDENPSFLLWKSDYSQVWGGFSTRSAAGGAGIGVYDPTIQASSGLGIYFLVNATTTAAFINSSGNFGIGIVSPSTKLHVNGVITATGGTSTDWNTAYSWGNHATAGYLTSVSDVWVNTTGDTMTGQLVISTTGTAGSPTLRINTSTAGSYVHSQENIAANLASGQRNILVVGQDTSTKNSGYFGYYWAGAGSDSNFITMGHWGNNDLFRIYGNGNANFQGNLSIGASTTTTNFEVIGSDAEVIVHSPGSSRGGLRALGGQLVGFMTTASSDDLVFGWENGYKGAFTERMRIDNGTGNVLINTTTDSGYKLDVNGSFRATSNSYLATASNTTVGIGVTTALAKLHVQGADALLLLQGNTAAGQYFPSFYIRGTYPKMLFQSEDGSVTFGTILTIQDYGSNPWGNIAISSRTGMHFLIQSYSGSSPVFSFDISGHTSVTNNLSVGAALTVTSNFTVDTDTFFVNATTNRVGVGTTSPSVLLQAGAKVIDDNNYAYTSGAAMFVNQTQTSASVLNDPQEVLILARQGTAGQAFGAAAVLELSRYENSGTNSRTRLDIKLADGFFLSNSNRVLTMLSNGNVGVGVTNPTAKLHVADNLLVTSVNYPGITVRGNYPTLTFQTEDTTVTYGTISTIQAYGTNPWGNLAIQSRTGLYFYISSFSNSVPALSFLGGNLQVGLNVDAGYKFDINGTLRSVNSAYFATTSGNVGIGTTSAVAKFNIVGGSANWNETTPGQTTGTIHLDPGVSTDNFGNAITFGASDFSDGDNAQAGIYVRSDGTYGTKMYFATTDYYITGSKTRMVIDNLGNIGINTASPAYNFDIRRTNLQVHLSSLAENQNVSLFFNTAYDSSTLPRTAIIASAVGSWSRSSLVFCLNNATSGNPGVGVADAKMIITPGGNVGIGTTSPDALLTVSADKFGTLGGAISVVNSSEGNGSVSGIYMGSYARKTAIFYNWTANYGRGELIFATNNVADGSNAWVTDGKMHIKANGNITIGTSTDSGFKLDVNGNTIIRGNLSMNDASNRYIYGLNGNYINLYNGGTGGVEIYGLNGTSENKVYGGLRVTGNLITQGSFSMNGSLDIGSNNSVYAMSNGITLYRGFDASMQFYLGHPTIGDFLWDYPAGTTLMTLKRGGNLLIGTTTNTGEKLQVNGDIKSTGVIKSMYQAGDEGGEITLNKPVTNTTLTTGVTIDVYQDKLRIFESGGTNRGGFFDLSALAAAVGTNFEPVGYTGILTIPGNPPGQQNVDIQNGRIVNVF